VFRAPPATSLRQLSDDAQAEGDRDTIEEVERTIRQMRGHLQGRELKDFDDVLRG
jgi:hypothetical protein